MIRGLDATCYTAEENTIIYLGIASYIADQRGIQDRKGNVLCELFQAPRCGCYQADC